MAHLAFTAGLSFNPPEPDPVDAAARKFSELYGGSNDPQLAQLRFEAWHAHWRGDIAKAEALFHQALTIAPHDTSCWRGLLWLCWWSHRHAEALTWIPAADRQTAGGQTVAGMILKAAGDYRAAEQEFLAAMTANPEDPFPHIGLGEILLRDGQWQRGWVEHEWRLRGHGWTRTLARLKGFAAPRWRGKPLTGKFLLVRQEGGLGDLMMFARYIPTLTRIVDRAGGEVTVAVPSTLARLWRTSFPGLDVIHHLDTDEAEFDYWIPAASLPFQLTGDEPPPAAPYLRPGREDVQAWRQQLRLHKDTLNIGVAWACSVPIISRPIAYFEVGDEDARPRTLPLDELAPLAQIPGVRWFSLQVGRNERDRAPEGMALERLAPQFRDFADTAAAASLLDIIVTVDNSVANLAGALGLPTWVLLPPSSDHRWGAGERSAWYPAARLFRQHRHGDWTPVVEQVADAMRQLVAARAAA